MKLSIIQIGNSRGVRIPKVILDQCKIENEVELEVQEGRVILEPIKGTPRQGWDEAFARMVDNEEDQLLIDDALDLNTGDWEW